MRSFVSIVVLAALAVLLSINDVNAVPLTERLHRRTRHQHHTQQRAHAVVSEEVARDAELFELHSVEGESVSADREAQWQLQALNTMSGAGGSGSGSEERKVAGPDFTIMNWNVRFWRGRLGVNKIAPLDAPSTYVPLKLWQSNFLGAVPDDADSVRGHPKEHARLEHDLTMILTRFAATPNAGVLVLEEAYYMYELIHKLMEVLKLSDRMHIASPVFARSPVQSKMTNANMYVTIIVIAKNGLTVNCASNPGMTRYALCTVAAADKVISARNPREWSFGAVHLRANMRGDISPAHHARELSCVLPGASLAVGDMNDDPDSLQAALYEQAAAAYAEQQKKQAASSAQASAPAPAQSVALPEVRKRRLSESAQSACALAVGDDTSPSAVDAERKAAEAPSGMSDEARARANANREKAMKILAEKEKAKAAKLQADQALAQAEIEATTPVVFFDGRQHHGTYRSGQRSAGFGQTLDFAVVNPLAATAFPVGRVIVETITDIDHDSDHQPISVQIFWP